MEMFWRTKGKRIAAWLMIALIMATTIPFGSIRASADNTATGESGTVTITGQVMVPDDTNENTGTSNGRAYAGAKVTVTYPQSGSTPVTNEATTTDDGKFNISIGDWTLNTDNKYTVKVEPADVDKGTYDSYSSEEKTVTEDQVKTKKIELGAITLKEKSVSYSVTANAETSDHSEKDDAGEVKVENNVVTAIPKEGYEITAVTVKKETADWKPDGETNDNWWNKKINASGAFVYEEFKDKTLDANYTFTITFAKKQFTITYKISQNGKLILNSDAQNDKVEITTESGEDGSRNVPYTDSEYKIKAAVTDNKYHLTSFRVDNDEKLNENEINNSLKEKEYIFSEGIKQAHSIEVTAEIDTYTVSVTTDDGGIVEVNGSSEKNIIVDSGAEVAIIVKPNEGKTVKIFSVNGTPIQENNLTEDEDGTAVYKIENVNGDQNVTAEFEDIQNENKDSLALAGLNLLDSGNNQITADEDGNYYSSSAILKFDGKTKISLSQWGVGKTQLNLTETTIISSVYKAANQAETVKADDFTIDKTRPVITVTYDNNNAVNGNYYAAVRTATIQIEEHNFSENRVRITGTATDNGAGISFPQSGGFTGNGDVHTATITCGTDGLYNFNVEYTDMAGNIAETYTGEEYYVDLTEPEIEIVGVEDYSANNGDVIPQIVMSDTNFDTNGVNIELVGANQGSVAPEGSYTNQGNGETFTFQNFPKEQSYDDIYTINATLTDMAGNESNATVTFSVNRFGSVYVFDQTLKDIEGTYIQNEIDVKLKEVNVDSLEHDKIKVVVDTNGTPRTLEEGIDYQVQESGGNGQWYQYDYTINKSLFAGDGRYIVTLYSEDIAGNVNENIDESKEAEISFGVDKTAPVVIPIDVESNAQYPVDTKAANVTVNDNLVLDSVEIYIGDKKCDYTVDGENYQFNIPNNTKKQDVTIMAVDAAGNKTNYVLNGILVTTNTFIRWYNNKPLFVGSIAGAAVVTGGGVGAAIALRSGRIKIRRKRK